MQYVNQLPLSTIDLLAMYPEHRTEWLRANKHRDPQNALYALRLRLLKRLDEDIAQYVQSRLEKALFCTKSCPELVKAKCLIEELEVELQEAYENR